MRVRQWFHRKNVFDRGAGPAPPTGAFTLIELMLVVAIIGLLAAIAIPKFADLVAKAREAAIRGDMGSVRSAISIYYADNESWYPELLWPCLIDKYLPKIPRAISIPTAPDHQKGSDVDMAGSNTAPAVFNAANDDFALAPFVPFAWRYTPHGGSFLVNCTHTDTRGTNWSVQ